MTTARQYNEAVDDQEHLRKRFVELTEQNIGLEQRVEELQAAVEDVNRAGVLKIRALEARLAKLEAVYEAGCKVHVARPTWGPPDLALALADLADALAATDLAPTEPPQDADKHCCEPCNEGGPDYP